MSKLKILLLTIYNYPHPGGISSHISNLRDGLTELKTKVEIFSTSSLSKLFNSFIRIIYFLRKLNLAIFYFFYLNILKIYFQIRLFVNYLKNKWNVINAQDPIALNCTKLIRIFFKPTLILTVHGFLAAETLVDLDTKNSFISNLLIKEEKKSYFDADRIITIENSRKEHILKYINNPKKILIRNNFVNTSIFRKFRNNYFKSKFSLPKEAYIILFPKRIVKASGVKYFIEAAKELLKIEKHYYFIILGKGYLLKKIKKLTKNQKNILYHDPIPNSFMPYLINSSKITVIPSISLGSTKEGSSMAIIESMACGIPVIATRVGGNPALIKSGKTGLLIPEKNSNAISETIIRLYEDKELWNKISINSREFIIKNYSHIKAAKFFLKNYFL